MTDYRNRIKALEYVNAADLTAHPGNWRDPFLGSGTTLIAAENLSRQCRAVELSPGYVAVALQRYLGTFGIEAELIGDG
jgi:hypothetical protein